MAGKSLVNFCGSESRENPFARFQVGRTNRRTERVLNNRIPTYTVSSPCKCRSLFASSGFLLAHVCGVCSISAKVEYIFLSFVCLNLALHTPTVFSVRRASGMQQ